MDVQDPSQRTRVAKNPGNATGYTIDEAKFEVRPGGQATVRAHDLASRVKELALPQRRVDGPNCIDVL